MISYKPARHDRAHIVLPLLLMLAGSVALFGAALAVSFMPAVLQAAGLALFAVAVFIITRYSLCTVYYTIGEDSPDLLCVYRITGNKKTVPISVDLTTSRSVIRVGENYEKQGKRRVNMCLNIFPRERVAILFGEGADSVELLIEADDVFFDEIVQRIGK